MERVQGDDRSIIRAVYDQFLSCPVCFEAYTSHEEHAPKILTCQHSFCQSCLVSMSSGDGTREIITCPHCRKITEIAPGGTEGVVQLPHNIFITNLLDIIKKHSKPLQLDDNPYTSPGKSDSRNDICPNAYNCAVCGIAVIVSNSAGGCIECGSLLCKGECETTHEWIGRGFRGHRVISHHEFCQQIALKQFTSTNAKVCVHDDIEYCCQDCREVTCPVCFALFHSGHKMFALQISNSAVSPGMHTKAINGEKAHTIADCPGVSGSRSRDVEDFNSCLQDLHHDISNAEEQLVQSISCKAAVMREELDIKARQFKGGLTISTLHAIAHHVGVATKAATAAVESLFHITTKQEGTHNLMRGAGTIGKGPGTGNGKLIGPRGMTFCSRSSTLFVVGNHRIHAFHAATGEHLRTIGTGKGSGQAELKGPCGLTLRLAPTGSLALSLLYVADYENNRVQVYDADTGDYVQMIGDGRGSAQGQLYGPSGLAIHLPVTGSGADAATVAVVGSGASTVATAAAAADDVGAATAAADVGAATAAADVGAATATTAAAASSSESSVAFLFVADFGNNRVQVFDAYTGTCCRVIGCGRDAGAVQLRCPFGLALQCHRSSAGSQALLYVSDRGNNRIEVFDADTGRHVRSIGCGKGKGPGQLKGPSGLALKELRSGPEPRSLLYVAEYENARIQVFDANTGAHVRMLGVGQLNGPLYVVLCERSEGGTLVFVTETATHQVRVLVDL